ncbi:MAG TPA: AMP-binding protein [Spirochaetota bacterium]|nr:AMP-binding protein [Spirochaetota bacterium]
MNLTRVLESNSRKHPDKDCLRYNGKKYTYKNILELSLQAASFFQSLGIEKGDKIAIMSQNTPDFVISLFGSWFAGATVVPINHKLMAPETEYILEHSEAKLFLFDGSLSGVADKIRLKKVKKMALDTEVSGYELFSNNLKSQKEPKPVKVNDDDFAEILYTSGTTGKPKGCLHTHRNVVMAGITAVIATKMDNDDVLLMAMPIWHSSPLNNWFAGILFIGGTTVLLREYHPLHFLQAIQNEKCTVYFGAPVSYTMPVQMIPNFDSFDLTTMRAWIYGGGPISSDVAKMIIEKYKTNNFYQVYGMTESGPTGTVLLPKEQLKKAGSIGKTGLPGCDLRIVKTDGKDAKPGETGEIWLRADSMMKGYYKNTEASKEAFEEDWYKTGDVARIDDDEYLFIVDRIKDMIVTGGENVYSKEVEDVIITMPGITGVAVIGLPHPDWGETVAAFVTKAQDGNISKESIVEYLTDKLAKYKIPKQFLFVYSLPYTPSGKVMKYKLRE